METLYLSDLSIVAFRNLTRVQMSPHVRFNVIAGQNGSGKTNLLESIYYFSALRSFRTTFRGELIQQGAPLARIEGRFGGAAAGLVAEITLTETTRKVLKNDKEVTRLSEHFSQLPMVLFHPANMALVQGGPRERRRYMDRALFQADPTYPTLLGDYQRALASRNSLLKSGSAERRLLGPYDAQIASLGAAIVGARRRFIDTAAGIFRSAFEKISLGLEGALAYRPDVDGESEAIARALDSGFDKDRKRGFTQRGPHADDLEISVKGFVARRFASQGQQRLAVLAMKIAEALALQEVTGRVPILLLDDLSSELDRERNRELFGFLRQTGGQVFITTTHLDHVLLDVDRMDFEIRSGALA